MEDTFNPNWVINYGLFGTNEARPYDRTLYL